MSCNGWNIYTNKLDISHKFLYALKEKLWLKLENSHIFYVTLIGLKSLKGYKQDYKWCLRDFIWNSQKAIFASLENSKLGEKVS